HADFVHQRAIIPAVHDDADAAGNGHLVRDDVAAGRGNIIAAGGSEVAHRNDHGLGLALFLVLAVAFSAGLKILDGVADFIGGENFAAGGIDFQNDGFDAAVVLSAVQLRLDDIHHAVTVLIHRAAADDSVHVDDTDFGRGIVVFQDGFIQARPDVTGAGHGRAAADMHDAAGELAENDE